MTEPEDDEVFAMRVAYVTGQIAAAEEDCVMSHLAEITGHDTRVYTDRSYGRLEAMSQRDLALAVVLQFNDRASEEAHRLWLQLRAMEAEDVKP